jgi:DNA-binding NtrC family response regulator
VSWRPIRLLVLEDDPPLSDVLCESLRDLGHQAMAARTMAEALHLLERNDFEVALLDLMLPDGSGLDVLRRMVEETLPTEAIVLTGHASIGTALQAMKLGAYDYQTKPASIEELEVLVEKAADKARLRQENAALRVRLERLEAARGLVTEDPGLRVLMETVERAAATELPVLVLGEAGAASDLVARALHQRGPRRAHPFVAVRCGAVSRALIESELFGHEKGAFAGAAARKPGLFEVADHGVLFLDEVAELPDHVQARIVRALDAKAFQRVGGMRVVRCDVRVVSATDKDLEQEVAAGRFRQDLYDRLNGFTLRLPPLPSRGGAAGEDSAHDWTAAAARAGLTLEEVERQYIQTVLADHHGHRGQTARALGLDPKTLYNKLGAARPRKGGEARR